MAKLHHLIHGDLDADRLDYVRRDLQTAGLITNTYDLGRLVDAAILECQNGDFEVRFTTEALSMLETFFSARSHLYHWMIWHHNVIRTNLGLSRALRILLTSPADKLPIAAAKLRGEIYDFALLRGGIERFELFNDSYVRTRLYEVLWQIESGQTANKGRTESRFASEETQQLKLFLKMFLQRDKQWLDTLWKRPDQYRSFASEVMGVVTGDDGNAPKWLNESLNAALEKRKKKRPTLTRSAQALGFVNELEAYLGGNGFKFIAYFIDSRFDAAPDNLKLKNLATSAYIGIKDISPTIAGLDEAWEQLPHLWLFSQRDQQPLVDARKRAQVRLAEFLKSGE